METIHIGCIIVGSDLCKYTGAIGKCFTNDASAAVMEHIRAKMDVSIPVLCMHAPMEIVSKLDCYMITLACKSIYLA